MTWRERHAAGDAAPGKKQRAHERPDPAEVPARGLRGAGATAGGIANES